MHPYLRSSTLIGVLITKKASCYKLLAFLFLFDLKMNGLKIDCFSINSIENRSAAIIMKVDILFRKYRVLTQNGRIFVK